MINYLDIAVVLIILVFALVAFYKGFIRMVFGSLPLIVSLVSAYLIYPTLSKFLRTTAIYLRFSTSIYEYLNLSNIIPETAIEAQTNLISQMNLPQFLKNALIENNNAVVYEILNVNELREYISGFISNLCINILSMIIVFIVVYIVCMMILKVLEGIASFPVLSGINRIFGLAVGVVHALLLLWIIGIFLTFFVADAKFEAFFNMLYSSRLALMLYENNFLLFMILRIFT